MFITVMGILKSLRLGSLTALKSGVLNEDRVRDSIANFSFVYLKAELYSIYSF
jgi:hypothetical protein